MIAGGGWSIQFRSVDIHDLSATTAGNVVIAASGMIGAAKVSTNRGVMLFDDVAVSGTLAATATASIAGGLIGEADAQCSLIRAQDVTVDLAVSTGWLAGGLFGDVASCNTLEINDATTRGVITGSSVGGLSGRGGCGSLAFPYTWNIDHFESQGSILNIDDGRDTVASGGLVGYFQDGGLSTNLTFSNNATTGVVGGARLDKAGGMVGIFRYWNGQTITLGQLHSPATFTANTWARTAGATAGVGYCFEYSQPVACPNVGTLLP